MRRPGGYGIITDPDAPTQEHDTFTCAHCNRVQIVQAKCRPEDLGGLCKVCMGMTCPQCTGHGCAPFEKRLEQWEARSAALRSYGLG